ncbi:MAG: hypothetical protein JSU66_10365 [Deltaproteobacteria bacterium]|nr:MAG: hypothetical protein JSU66_10365 [Deltaproteobacteria bacterium]
MHKKLVLAVLASAPIALAAAAQNPLAPDGPFVVGEAGLEVADTGLAVRDTELSIAALYHSCPEMAGEKPKKLKLEKLAKKGLLIAADDIPVAHTPGCGYEEFPPPVLAACNEPLVAGAPDLRGLWVVHQGAFPGHVERIEQCGNRIVITGGGVIHDMRADGTLANGVNDVSAIDCNPIQVAAEFNDGSHDLKPFGLAVLVTRTLEGEELIWNFLGRSNRLVKLCDLAP